MPEPLHSEPHFHDKSHKGFDWASRISTILGVGCAIHCALTPLFVLFLPVAGSFLQNEALEWGLIGISFVLGLLSLQHGYRKHHHSLDALIWFFAGFALFVLSHLLEDYPYASYPLLLIAAISMIYAQWRNYRLNQAAACVVKH